ncbi:MAG TPA: prepilin-type N-terminal cleavage/methylation domain-containing protein [Verrucomicrobiae bacterium]|nr:prepilin-type N-terminal cleavage/methylation domain-containing protein [Verrucomicrobiae bacterium]
MKLNEKCRVGFTLVELLASMAILGLIMVMLFSAFNQVNKAWLMGESRVETFTQARAALDFMTKELSQAIVTTNIIFVGNANNIAFVAPLNGGTGAVDIVEVVYRPDWRPGQPIVTLDPGNIFTNAVNTWPAKLVRRTSFFDAPASAGWDYGHGQACTVRPWDFYPVAPNVVPNPDWPETSISNRTAVLAENVMSLTFDYYDANGNLMNPDYWNSNRALSTATWQNELPPATAIPAGLPLMIDRAPGGVQITIGVIDSRTAVKLSTLTSGSAPWNALTNQATRTFTTYVAIPNGRP